MIGGLFVSTAPDFEASNFPINVSHTCGSELVLAIVNEDYEDVSGGSLSDNRLIIPYFRPGYMIQLFGPSETCYVSHVQVGDPDPEPELREIIGDFSPTSLLSIAGDLVTYMGSIIAIVGGVLLGFRLLGLLIRWLRGR